jgi:uncharacterized protein (DUF697 family)
VNQSSLRNLDDARGPLDEMLRVLDRLPFVSGVKRDVLSLRELLYHRRAPRIAAFGLPGSGRTSLATALLGKGALPDGIEMGRWVRVDAAGSLVDWLEVPLGPGAEMRDHVRNAADEMRPDVAILVCAPRDLDGALAGAAAEIREHLGWLESPDVAFAVLTHADAIPPTTAGPPYPDGKGHAIDLTRERLERVLREANVEIHAVRAVSTRDGHGIPDLSEALLEKLPERARVEAARALVHARRGRREVANRIVHSSSTLALTVGMAPVPFSDAFVIAPLQVTMVSAIAHLAGRPWDKKTVAEWMASMGVVGGAGMGLRWTARQLLKFVPGAGTLVSAGIAGAGTVTIGQSAIAYFLRHEPKQITAG